LIKVNRSRSRVVQTLRQNGRLSDWTGSR